MINRCEAPPLHEGSPPRFRVGRHRPRAQVVVQVGRRSVHDEQPRRDQRRTEERRQDVADDGYRSDGDEKEQAELGDDVLLAALADLSLSVIATPQT